MTLSPRRAALATWSALLVTVLVVSGALVVAGNRTNQQINGLRHHGVIVHVTVDECLGQLGGSGSNAASYTCSGTFVLGKKIYRTTLPGSAFLQTGKKLDFVTAATNPGLIASRQQISHERASNSFLVLPSLLLVAWIGTFLAWSRSRRHVQPDLQTTSSGGPF